MGKCLELQTETKQKLVIRNSLITKRVVIVCCKSPRPGSQRKERIQESSMSKHTIMMASSLSSPHPTGEYSNNISPREWTCHLSHEELIIVTKTSLKNPHPTGEYSNIVKENGRVTKAMKSLSM